MSDPFLAEIRVVPFNFAPRGWAFCDGQLLPLSQNTALFALLGTMYGGDGKTNFALPDLQDSAVVGPGQGPGLSEYVEGQVGGSSTTTLLQSEMPVHSHTARKSVEPGDNRLPSPTVSLATSTGGFIYQSNSASNLVPMAPQAATPTGDGLPHNNMMPYLVLHFIIALQGIFPSRH